MDYEAFIRNKGQGGEQQGFAPHWMPSTLYDFQQSLVTWALERGRAAIFADCGLGKTAMQLVWAQNVVEQTNRPVLILTPLAVGAQTVQEGQKFSVECFRSRDGIYPQEARIIVTNYEQLHKFNPTDFAGVVCDESSILKHFSGATQKAVTRFMAHTPYRLLCTATAAPNDHTELGTSAEALGELGMRDMLTRFFKQEQHSYRIQMQRGASDIAGTGGGWRLKGHAAQPFWRWVASWARACRKPSDLGFDDGAFQLPPLLEKEHTVQACAFARGLLFDLPAQTMQEERQERRHTLRERCEYAASLTAHNAPSIIWCHLNDEGDLLKTLIPGSQQVKGSDTDNAKERAYADFVSGNIRVLVIKPQIGAYGLNWQHCAHVVTFATHSYEQYYQSVRRCWRFGQPHPVQVDIIATEGEARIQANMHRKAKAADVMFTTLVAEMNHAVSLARVSMDTEPITMPSWL